MICYGGSIGSILGAVGGILHRICVWHKAKEAIHDIEEYTKDNEVVTSFNYLFPFLDFCFPRLDFSPAGENFCF